MKYLALTLLASAAGTGAAQAQLAVGAGIGTSGATAEAQFRMSDTIQLRGNGNWFEYGVDDEYDDVAYDGDLDLKTFGAFVDYHPFAGAFLISLGAYFGDKKLDLNATPTANVEIGSGTFTPAQVGTLTLDGQLEDTAPFLGVGWDTTFQGDSIWGFKVLLGAMWTGEPQINLTSTGGTLSSDPAFQTQLAQEEQNLRDEVDNYEFYPVVQAGLTFGF